MNTMDDYLLSDISRFIGKLHSAVEEFEFREADHDSLPRVINKIRDAIKDVEVLYLIENTRANSAAERALRVGKQKKTPPRWVAHKDGQLTDDTGAHITYCIDYSAADYLAREYNALRSE